MFGPEPDRVILEDAVVLEQARSEDSEDILALLERSRLPLDGLRDHLATTIVVRQDGRVVGSAALELYQGAALLRSVAVDPALQGRGLGCALTEAALRLARERGVAERLDQEAREAEPVKKVEIPEVGCRGRRISGHNQL